MEKTVKVSHRSRSLVWSGYAVLIWSIAYMLPHLYWGLGGVRGLILFTPLVLEFPQLKLINLVASVFLIAAGCLGLAFIYFKHRNLTSGLLLAITLIGCSISTSHGIYGVVYRILQITGVVELDSETFNGQHFSYVLWDLFLFEPWFLIEGILLGVVGWFYLNKPRHRQIWFILCLVGITVGIITGLLGVRFA
ncbi:MAG TPA: DUF3995 domain-containing protein [Bacillales bacterium]|nr:DUF3995 domain-containing protein [Bacillales bacterium]